MKSVPCTPTPARVATIALLTLLSGAADAAQDPAHVYPLSLAAGSRLLIDAKINGHPVVALLDSAAEATILDRSFAQALKLQGGQAVAGQGSGQASFAATLIHGVRLEALGLSLAGQTVAVADLTDVGHRLLQQRLDVILGREIFDAARLAIDIDGRRIGVVPRNREPRGVRLELVSEHGVETVPVSVEGGAVVRATFDLGNGARVLMSTALARRMRVLADGRPVSTEHGGGLGGEAERQVFTLKYIEVAGRRFSQVGAAIDSQPSASDLNIGVSVLRHYRLTTDFAQHAVWLDARD